MPICISGWYAVWCNSAPMTNGDTAMKLITCTTAMDKAIDSIATRGTKLDGDIHIMAVSAGLHVVVHGDTTYVNKLIAKLPRGLRSVALKAWFEEFAPVTYNDETEVFDTDKVNAKAMKVELDDKELPCSLALGVAKSWVECKPEQPYKAMNFTGVIAKAVKEAEKRIVAATKDGDKGDKIDIKLVATIKALLPSKQD